MKIKMSDFWLVRPDIDNEVYPIWGQGILVESKAEGIEYIRQLTGEEPKIMLDELHSCWAFTSNMRFDLSSIEQVVFK